MRRTFMLVIALVLMVCLLGISACGQSSDDKTNRQPTASPSDETAGSTAASATTQSANPGASPSLRVSYIDVGKGDCMLVQANGAAILIDAGYDKTAKDVLSLLQEQGIKQLDAVVLTHYDRDHVSGIYDIGKGVDIGTIYLPGYEGSDDNYYECIDAVEKLEVPSKLVTKKLDLNVGGARLTVYPSTVTYQPGSDDGEEGNDNDMSLVATLTNGSDSYLFAGDLEEEGIDAYLAGKHGTFDVLKMPHHGRNSSNTEDFVDDVRPQIAIITDSKKESADKKVTKLLKSYDAEAYRTSKDGTIVVESDGNGNYQVSTSK